MNNEQIYYENDSFWEKERYLKNNAEMERFKTAKALIPSDIKSLCDIGCGNGAFLHFLENKKVSYFINGAERADAAINNKCCKSNIDKGDIISLSYDDSSFDMVSCMEVIEHLPFDSYSIAIEELQRIAKEYLLISVPYKERIVHVKCKHCGCSFSPYYHLRTFDEEILNNLFTDFELCHFKYVSDTYILKPLVSKMVYIKNILKEKSAEKNTLCPQCGFKELSNKTNVKVTYNPYKQKIVKMLSYKQPRWIMALYKRKTE